MAAPRGTRGPAQPSEGAVQSQHFAEHLFSYWEIAQLQPDAAQQALTLPAAGEGVAWDEDAVRYVMTETRGHPYLLQAYGQATWDAAEGATLTYDDARVGLCQGRHIWIPGFTDPSGNGPPVRSVLTSKRWPWTPAARAILVTSPRG